MVTDKHNTQTPNAWLLDFGAGLHAAVGKYVLLQLIDNPLLHPVPCTPDYCHHIVAWHERLLPVVDMAVRLDESSQSPHFLVIVGYQDLPANVTRFGALLLSSPPNAIAITDTQACPLPEHPATWSELALSCCNYQNAPIPILNLARIFSRSADLAFEPQPIDLPTMTYAQSHLA